MADTLFVNASTTVPGTPIVAPWMNDVNTNTYTILAGIAGTNTITGTGASTVTVGYPRGVAFRFLPIGPNTGAVTINISGLGVRNVTKFGATALTAGDLLTGMWAYITYDGTQFQLINPATSRSGGLIAIRTFLASATYTPTVGTNLIIVEVQAGGGAGGGAAATGVGQVSVGTGGGAGGFARHIMSTGFAGAAIVVGAGGAGVVGAAGNSGNTSSFAGTINALGGSGGGTIAPGAPGVSGSGGAGGNAAGGNLLDIVGGAGGYAFTVNSGCGQTGAGGPSFYGGAGQSIGALLSSTTVGGNAGAGPGAGGSGSRAGQSQPAVAGGNGAQGHVIVYEYY